MAVISTRNRVLDARPDRIDFRDRQYRPPLVSLPASFPSDVEISAFLPRYREMERVLNQGREGACTGFGLAAVINYIIWDRWMRAAMGEPDPSTAPPMVSPWMLYDNARMYDEWEGEAYSGSSCRGAMKGWHKHGVCNDGLWMRDMSDPNRAPVYLRPKDGWQLDAANRPLGAYYRVDTKSISDMQSAICEVRAVFCSAKVHAGWDLKDKSYAVDIAGLTLPVIRPSSNMTGGHAFAIMGFTADGFIVQNSWGPNWGYAGFGLLLYEDWAKNGHDAWVAAMAAPMKVAGSAEVPKSRAEAPLLFNATVHAQVADRADTRQIWSRDKAYEHSVVLGNEGRVIRRLTDTKDAADNLLKVVHDVPERAVEAGARHVVLYAHGGLNSEKAAIERAMRMGPWFEANGIVPLFLVWRTSLTETLQNIGSDFVDQFMSERTKLESKGFGNSVSVAVEKLQNQFDKAFEAAAANFIGKAVWHQMKQNAAAAARDEGATRQVALLLAEFRRKHPKIGLHIMGHSAGAILLGRCWATCRRSMRLTQRISLHRPRPSTSRSEPSGGRLRKARSRQASCSSTTCRLKTS